MCKLEWCLRMLTKVALFMLICVVLDPVNGIGWVSVFSLLMMYLNYCSLLMWWVIPSHRVAKHIKYAWLWSTHCKVGAVECLTLRFFLCEISYCIWGVSFPHHDNVKQLQDKDLSTADYLRQSFDSAHIHLALGGCLGLVFCVCICMVSLCNKSWLSRWSLSSCLTLCCVSWFIRCHRSHNQFFGYGIKNIW